MNKRLMTLVCLVLFLSQFTSLAEEKPTDKPSEGSSVWVTSIEPLSNDTFVAATASGLLLREATVSSFTLAAPEKLTQLYTHPAAVWDVTVSQDGKTIASVDYRGNLVVYDVASKMATTHEKAFERWCQELRFTPDAQSVIAGNESGKVMVWSLPEKKITSSLEVDKQAITSLAFSGDGKQVAASDGAGYVHLLEYPALKSVGKIKFSEDPAWCVSYAGEELLVGSGDRYLYRCSAKADAKPEAIAKGKDWITRLAVSKNGRMAVSSLDGQLFLPKKGNSKEVGSADAATKSGVWALCFADDKTLLIGTRKEGIVIAKESDSWNKPLPPPPAKQTTEEPAKTEPAKTESAKDAPKPAEKKEAEKQDDKKTEAKDEPKPPQK